MRGALPSCAAGVRAALVAPVHRLRVYARPANFRLSVCIRRSAPSAFAAATSVVSLKPGIILSPVVRRVASPRAAAGTMSREPAAAADAPLLSMSHDALSGLLVTAHGDDTIRAWRRGPRGAAWELLVCARAAHKHAALRDAVVAPPALRAALVASIGTDAVVALYFLPALVAGTASRRTVSAQALQLREARAPLFSVAFSEDGALASLGEEHVVRVYGCEPESMLHGVGNWTLLAAVDLGPGTGYGLSFMPGGSDVLSAGSVIVARGRSPWEYSVFADLDTTNVCCLDWGRAGFIAAGRTDGTLEIWEMMGEASRRVATLGPDGVGHIRGENSTAVERVQWDLHGRVVASAYADGVVRLWAQKAAHARNGEKHWPWSLRDTLQPEAVASNALSPSDAIFVH